MLFYFLLGMSTREPLDQATLPEKEHRRDAADTILGSGQRIFIHVKFGYFYAVGIVCRQFVDNRGQGPAGAAPGSPAIHHYGSIRGQHLPGKRIVGNVNRFNLLAGDNERLFALAAQRTGVQALFRHAVFCTAPQAADDQVIERGVAVAAGGASLELPVRDTIFGAAIKAPDNDIVRHIKFLVTWMLVIVYPPPPVD